MANIYYRRRALGQLLRRELSNRFLVVPNPDHPLLLRGPDILVAGETATTAIFAPLAAERRSESLLRSRFILSRLALPPYVRCILVAEPEDHRLAHSFSADFAYVIDWSSREELISIVSSGDIPSGHRDIPPEIVADTQVRFANAMTVMRLGARLTAKPFSAAFDEKSDLRHPERSSVRRPKRRPLIDRDATSTGLQGVALTELSDSEVDPSLVSDMIQQQTEYSFAIDTGIPYLTGDPSGFAMVRDWPARTRDSEKLILSAAFGGWAFVLEELRSELPRFAKRLNLRRYP